MKNKKLLLSFILGILLLSFTSAFTVSDFAVDEAKQLELKSKTNYGTITLKDRYFVDVLGWFDKDLAKLTLKENTDSCGNDCYAIKDIELFEDGSLVDDVRFYRIYEDGKQELSSIRSYEVLIKTDEKTSIEDVYEYQCKETGFINANGTAEMSCSNVKIGTKEVVEDIWGKYNLGDKMPRGTYTVKLIGEKRADWSYDWQVLSQGYWTEEWSSWGGIPINLSDYRNYWRMENGSDFGQDSKGLINLTTTGTLNTIKGVSGNGTYKNGDTTANYLGRTTAFIDTSVNAYGTLSFWFNISSSSADKGLMGRGTTGSTTKWLLFIDANNKLTGYANDGGFSNIGGDVNYGVFNHAVFQWNTTGSTIWLNGIKAGISTGTPASGGTGGDFFLRTYHTFAQNKNLTIDEMVFWNRTLNESEILVLANYNFFPLTLGSSITLNSPIDNYISPTSNVNFNCSANVVGGATLKNISLYHNYTGTWVRNKTIQMGGSITTNTSTFPTTFASDKVFNWGIQACDSDNACGWSENRTVSIDTTAPTINLLYPTGTIPYGYVGQNISLNYSITDSPSNCWYNYNGTNITTPCTTNASLILTTAKSILMYANDSAGNLRTSPFSWDYTIFENSRTFNTTSYETATETFSLNATGLTSANLIFNGTSYTGSISGGIATASLTHIPITGLGNKSFYWSLNGGIINTTPLNYQNILATNLTFCNYNSSINITYINFTFKDETTLGDIDAAIDLSTWTYWLGDGSQTKTLLFTNTTENTNYGFCFTPSSRTLKNTREVKYSASGYPQRTYSASSSLTNITTNQTLYLLGSGDGIYVTMYLVNSQGLAITDVNVVVSREFSGEDVTIGEEITDDAGSVTFWLNPNYDHTFIFTKTGCTTTTTTIRPTQSQYTQPLSCGGSGSTDDAIYSTIVEGIRYLRSPPSGVTVPGSQNFTYYVYSDNSNLAGIKMEVVDFNLNILASSTTTCSNSSICQTSVVYDTTSGNHLKGKYYVNVSGYGPWILLEGDAQWRFITTNTSDSGSIKDFFEQLKYLFNIWGDEDLGYTCSIKTSELTCEADANCKWENDGTYEGYCIPYDTTNKVEYSKIVLLFLFMAIALAMLNKFTAFDSSYPGMGLILVGAMIIVASASGGFSCANQGCQGIFYYDGLFNGTSYAAGFANNYMLSITTLLFIVGYYFSVQRRYT